jgi:hypothetical protein
VTYALNKTFVVFLFFLAGCTSASSQILIPSPSSQFFSSPTIAIFPSQTHIPTLIPIPTPVGEDAENKVTYLLQTNGNCSLPCWWGITPGRTTWAEAEVYFKPFANIIYPPSSPQPDEGIIYTHAEFPDPGSSSQNDYFFSTFLVNRSGIVETIISVTRFNLSSTLSFFGVPSQIWIRIISLFYPYEYTLVLFYDNGMMSVFYGTTPSFFTICYEDIPERSQLWVWDPHTTKTIEVLDHLGINLPLTPECGFRSLDEVSDLQSQQFYDYFVDPSATQCIQIPWSDW